MKIMLLGIAIILFGIAKNNAQSIVIIVSIIDLYISIIGYFKNDKK